MKGSTFPQFDFSLGRGEGKGGDTPVQQSGDRQD